MRSSEIVVKVEVAGRALCAVVHRARRSRTYAPILGAFLVCGAVAACGSTGAPTPTGRPKATVSTSQSPSVDPQAAAATAKALAAYQGYVRVYASAAAAANTNDPHLATYIGGPLLSLSRHNLRVLQQHGAVELGTPKATVTSSTVDLSASPPTVTIESCVDYSDYRLVYKSNQSPVPNSALKLKRYTSTVTVTLFANGQWLVSADAPHRDTPC